jgi:hypothetical protein
MKENILFVILLCAGIGAGFYAGVYVTEEKTEDRLQSAPHRRDTSTTVIETPQPEQQREVKTKPRLTPEHRIDADSVFNAGYTKGIDSARAVFAYYTAPRETSIVFDSAGKLLHRSDRLREMEVYRFSPFPRREVERTITDTIYVPTLTDDRSWYDRWYWGSLATIILIYGASQI